MHHNYVKELTVSMNTGNIQGHFVEVAKLLPEFVVL